MNASPLKIIFLGSADISATVLEALANTPDARILTTITQPDRPAGRRRILTPCDCRKRALELGLQTLVPENINTPETLATLRALKPDLIVVVAYGQFLGNELLSLPPLGCVNLHVSLLPAYRGASPIQTAILRGETVTGVTLMQMDQGMDTGPILATASTPIAPEETAGELSARLAPLAAHLLIDNLRPLANRTLPPRPQDHAQATFARKFKKQDGQLDWARPAKELHQRIRACNPWPGATARLTNQPDSKMLKIHRARILPQTTIQASPGTILDHHPEGPLVACSTDSLLLTQVQPEGKRIMSGADFLRGTNLPPGTRLY